jgi:hypothetical protein
MSSGQELRDFARGFRGGVAAAGSMSSRQYTDALRDRIRSPKEAEPGIIDPFDNDVTIRSTSSSSPGTTSSSGSSKPGEIESYIRQASSRYGVDPDVVVRVAQSEGGLDDPFRQGEAKLKYGREESYGPFQLHMRMGGVGERALKEARRPSKRPAWTAGSSSAFPPTNLKLRRLPNPRRQRHR